MHFIRSISFKGLLSFDKNKLFEIKDLKRVNIFIGENSSGKSNIFRAIIGFTPTSDYEIHIIFDNDKQIHESLNRYNEEHPENISFFEIPPFRNLIIPPNFYDWIQDERSGIINNARIRGNENFYKRLREIIEIEDFALKEDPKKLINGEIAYEHWKDCGQYNFKRSNKDINIDLLGWGTKSVIIIYYNLFFCRNSIVFIEEPEISTHPKLLKNLFDWAFQKEFKDKYQFFITTHSSLLIDKIFLGLEDNDVEIFKVFKDKNNHTQAEPVLGKIEGFKILDQLGYKSSNLLFANYLIWVEGPSDIYYYEAFLNMAGFLKHEEIGAGDAFYLLVLQSEAEGIWYDIWNF